MPNNNPILLFCADLQARETAYRARPEMHDDDLHALAQAVELANAYDVPLVMGGDQVDAPNIGDEHSIKLRQILRKLKAQCLYVNGNHEKGYRRFDLEGGPASVALNLDSIERVENSLPPTVTISGFKIAGFNWRCRKDWEALIESKKFVCGKPLADILILHGFCEQVVDFLKLNPDTKSSRDINLDWFDGVAPLVLMGDIHVEWDYQAKKSRFLYSGSMWMHRLGEPENKSVILVNRDLSVERIPLVNRPFASLAIKTKKQLEEAVAWVRSADKLPPVLGVEYAVSKPRLHVSLPDTLEAEGSALIDILDTEAHLFKRLDVSVEDAITAPAASDGSHVDLLTALKRVLNESDEIDVAAGELIKRCVSTGNIEESSEKLRESIGI